MSHNKTTEDKSKSGPHWYKLYIRNVCTLYACVAGLIFHSMVSTIYMITYWIAILVNYFDAFVNSHCNDVMISDGVSNHRHLDCLRNRLFRRRLEEASKIRVTGLCEGNTRATGGLPVTLKMFPFDDVFMNIFYYALHLVVVVTNWIVYVLVYSSTETRSLG